MDSGYHHLGITMAGEVNWTESGIKDRSENDTSVSVRNDSSSHRLSFEKMVSLNVMVVVVLLSFFANGLVLFAIWTSKHFRKPMNFMIGNLVVASILQVTGVFGFFLVKSTTMSIAGEWSWICHLIPGLLRMPIPAEVFSVLCVALDRIRVVQNPLDVETALRAKKKIGMVWITALVMEMPLGIFWTWRESLADKKEFQCYNARTLGESSVPWILYVVAYLSVVYILPSLSLLRGLSKLIVLLKCILRAPCSTYLKTIDHHDLLSINAGRKREAIRNAILFIGIFILMKLPTGLWHAVYDLPVDFVPGNLRKLIVATRPAFAVLFISHFALYPAVVFALSREIRKFYKDLVRCKNPAPVRCSEKCSTRMCTNEGNVGGLSD